MENSSKKQDAVKMAEEKFKEGFNCAEATLAGVSKAMGLPSYPSGIATGFGGGIGRCGSICGALTGGVMAISLQFNRSSPEDKEEYALIMERTAQFINSFQEIFGSIDCPELAGYDLRLIEERKKFARDPKRREKCASYVREAAKLAAGIMEKSGK